MDPPVRPEPPTPLELRLRRAEELLDALANDIANGVEGKLVLARHMERKALLEELDRET